MKYIWNVAHGDLGRSVREMAPVSKLIGDTLPNTLILTGAGMLLTLLVGIPLGLISGARAGSWVDHLSRIISLLGLCTPVFLDRPDPDLHIQPSPGLVSRGGGTGSLAHLVLPAVTLAAYTMAAIARMSRSSLMEVLAEDYIRTARAKGLAFWVVVWRHGFRNALIPIITVFGMQVGNLMGGAILTETVFFLAGTRAPDDGRHHGQGLPAAPGHHPGFFPQPIFLLTSWWICPTG